MEGLNQWNDMMLFIARKKREGREEKARGKEGKKKEGQTLATVSRMPFMVLRVKAVVFS